MTVLSRGRVLEPGRGLVLTVVLLVAGFAFAFLGGRVAVRASDERSLADHHQAAAIQARLAGDATEANTRSRSSERFAATADEYGTVATLFEISGALFLLPGAGLGFRRYRNRSGSVAREADVGTPTRGAVHPGPRRPATAASMNAGRGRSSDVFVSYAREDQDFARELVGRLSASRHEVWVDWQDIPHTADWFDEIRHAIEATGTVVFIISPHSATSPVCRAELEHAAREGERIVPVLHRHAAAQTVPPVVAASNWIFFRPEDDPRVAFQQLGYAVDTDLEWVRFHTGLLVRAKAWQENRSSASLLLGEAELENADRHTIGTPDRRPSLSALQTAYLAASQYGRTVRQRKQLRGFYLAGIAYGLLQPAVTYALAPDQITESGLLALAPLWILALAFGISGLLMTRPTLTRAGAIAVVAAVLMVILYETVWPWW
ncbi:MAG: toll/interleukin-1 receptor domain-containing protein [Pseudonocardia sp.]|nr:toll/interleukin-1 receptor domain-containing protein [Pseudonocardia sp.]